MHMTISASYPSFHDIIRRVQIELQPFQIPQRRAVRANVGSKKLAL